MTTGVAQCASVATAAYPLDDDVSELLRQVISYEICSRIIHDACTLNIPQRMNNGV